MRWLLLDLVVPRSAVAASGYLRPLVGHRSWSPVRGG